jgi:uncharacterized protein YggU (UPF0235/DUF167 family)
VISLSYILFEKYNDLKLNIEQSIKDELYNEIPPFDFYYVDADEKRNFYDLARAEHLNDNVEKVVDVYIDNHPEDGSANREIIEVYKEEYKNEKQKLDSKIEQIRLKIRNEIVWNRIKNTAEKAIDKKQRELDSLRDIESEKIEILAGKKVQNENIIKHFSIPYLLGAFFGASILPILFWLIWLFLKTRLKKLFKLEKNQKIETIENHQEFANEYTRKFESLLELERSKIINESQFIEKHDNLIQYYYLRIMEEKRIDEKNELEMKLKTALDLGNITQEEFDSKIGYSRASKLNLKLDETLCPVCENSLSPKDKSCIVCGLQIRQ